jgi:hypothetical protein
MRKTATICFTMGVLHLTTVACGVKPDNHTGSGSGGAPGAGDLGDGGPRTPPSRAEATIHYGLPADMNKRCPPDRHFTNIPSVTSIELQTSGSMRAGSMAVDGENGDEVVCSVKPNGASFDVSAQLRCHAIDPRGAPLPVPTQLQLTTTISKDASAARGSLSIAEDSTAGNFYRSDDCSFSVQPSAMNPMLAIDSGKVWGSVLCSKAIDPSDPSGECNIDVGYFVLENCSQ